MERLVSLWLPNSYTLPTKEITLNSSLVKHRRVHIIGEFIILRKLHFLIKSELTKIRRFSFRDYSSIATVFPTVQLTTFFVAFFVCASRRLINKLFNTNSLNWKFVNAYEYHYPRVGIVLKRSCLCPPEP